MPSPTSVASRNRPPTYCRPFSTLFQMQRVYLAGPAPGWVSALEFARRHPRCPRSPACSWTFRAPMPKFRPLAADCPYRPSIRHDPANPHPPRRRRQPGTPRRRSPVSRPAPLPHRHHGPAWRGAQPALPRSPQRQFPHLMMQFLLDREASSQPGSRRFVSVVAGGALYTAFIRCLPAVPQRWWPPHSELVIPLR